MTLRKTNTLIVINSISIKISRISFLFVSLFHSIEKKNGWNKRMSVTSHSDGFQGQKDEIRKNKKRRKNEKTKRQKQKQNKNVKMSLTPSHLQSAPHALLLFTFNFTNYHL